MERYHELSETTMDTLLESLETLVDDLADSAYEVEYHVRHFGPIASGLL
jgi:frataxin